MRTGVQPQFDEKREKYEEKRALNFRSFLRI